MKLTGNGKLGLSSLSDANTKLLSKKGLETYMGHFPAGASFKQVNHFRQLVIAKKFQQYDYGPDKNTELYGQSSPPLYDMGKIRDVPIALFCGSNDLLAST